MKDLPIRKFTTVVGYLTEAVAITIDGKKVGVYTPLVRQAGEVIAGTIDLGPNVTEATVDEIKKAIEPEQVKVVRPGTPTEKPKLSKGLGDVPGLTKDHDEIGWSRPAPKPGKK